MVRAVYHAFQMVLKYAIVRLFARPIGCRFGIRPGYRWDGVCRGTGFEAKVMGRAAGRAARDEEAYRWSAADM